VAIDGSGQLRGHKIKKTHVAPCVAIFRSFGLICSKRCARILREKLAWTIPITFQNAPSNDGRCMTYAVSSANQSCPVAGEYQATSRDGCVHRMSVGCQHATYIDINLDCTGPATAGKIHHVIITTAKLLQREATLLPLPQIPHPVVDRGPV